MEAPRQDGQPPAVSSACHALTHTLTRSHTVTYAHAHSHTHVCGHTLSHTCTRTSSLPANHSLRLHSSGRASGLSGGHRLLKVTPDVPTGVTVECEDWDGSVSSMSQLGSMPAGPRSSVSWDLLSTLLPWCPAQGIPTFLSH